MKPMKAVELLIEKIKKDYSKDVSLVLIMGSAIYNDTHSRSDIDMFYVPKTERGNNLSFTCIIDEIGYDFWAVSWERLTRIANHEERIASVITDGKILYSASEEDMKHFQDLKAKALDVSDKPHFISMAEDIINKACVHVVDIQASDCMRDVRYHSIHVIYAIGQVLALINGIPVKRGRGKLKGELLAMPIKPAQFEARYDTLFFSQDIHAIKAAVLRLFADVKGLVNEEKTKYTPVCSFQENWSELYEELINAYNKIGHACEIKDPVTALFAAAELVNEIESESEFTGVDVAALPDMIGVYNPEDLSQFQEVAKEHKAALETLLSKNGIPIRRFTDFEELEAYLERL